MRFLILFATLAAYSGLAQGSPTAHVLPKSGAPVNKASGTQVIEQCTVPGQVALTFDGQFFHLDSRMEPYSL
jgi:hypothetical protein